jgi:hypothetical protein
VVVCVTLAAARVVRVALAVLRGRSAAAVVRAALAALRGRAMRAR